VRTKNQYWAKGKATSAAVHTGQGKGAQQRTCIDVERKNINDAGGVAAFLQENWAKAPSKKRGVKEMFKKGLGGSKKKVESSMVKVKGGHFQVLKSF